MAKPRKVEEPAGTYSASPKPDVKVSKSTPQAGVRYVDAATASRLTDKIFEERKHLLHQLAR